MNSEEFQRGLKAGLEQAIYVVSRERYIADVISEDKAFMQAYRLATANIMVMLIDEMCIQCSGDVIELQAKRL